MEMEQIMFKRRDGCEPNIPLYLLGFDQPVGYPM